MVIPEADEVEDVQLDMADALLAQPAPPQPPPPLPPPQSNSETSP
ncbi:hypothetical protein ACFQ8Q_16310 [Streptomyces cyaneofuscatus]